MLSSRSQSNCCAKSQLSYFIDIFLKAAERAGLIASTRRPLKSAAGMGKAE